MRSESRYLGKLRAALERRGHQLRVRDLFFSLGRLASRARGPMGWRGALRDVVLARIFAAAGLDERFEPSARGGPFAAYPGIADRRPVPEVPAPDPDDALHFAGADRAAAPAQRAQAGADSAWAVWM